MSAILNEWRCEHVFICLSLFVHKTSPFCLACLDLPALPWYELSLTGGDQHGQKTSHCTLVYLNLSFPVTLCDMLKFFNCSTLGSEIIYRWCIIHFHLHCCTLCVSCYHCYARNQYTWIRHHFLISAKIYSCSLLQIKYVKFHPHTMLCSIQTSCFCKLWKVINYHMTHIL